MNSAHRTRLFTGPRAIQNARTRIYIPGSDPLFSPLARRNKTQPFARRAQPSGSESTEPRVFTPGLVDRLQTPLTRYVE